MKSVFVSLLIIALLASLAGCAETKTLTCDRCGKQFEVPESSNMEDSWIVFCDVCGPEVEADVMDILE